MGSVNVNGQGNRLTGSRSHLVADLPGEAIEIGDDDLHEGKGARSLRVACPPAASRNNLVVREPDGPGLV